jgi:exopolyphosphatase / guanosine-5'-triphosphate,3'-diphosphate pyrophosphatase
MVQAARVTALSQRIFAQLIPSAGASEHNAQHLTWAARLHEIGISIAYNGFHKHSAYIIEYADMPGFSRTEQSRLATLMLGQRGTLAKLAARIGHDDDWNAVLALRLAVLLHRGRNDMDLPVLRVTREGTRLTLELDPQWMQLNPLTEAALESERKVWRSVGMEFGVEPRGPKAAKFPSANSALPA